METTVTITQTDKIMFTITITITTKVIITTIMYKQTNASQLNHKPTTDMGIVDKALHLVLPLLLPLRHLVHHPLHQPLLHQEIK